MQRVDDFAHAFLKSAVNWIRLGPEPFAGRRAARQSSADDSKSRTREAHSTLATRAGLQRSSRGRSS